MAVVTPAYFAKRVAHTVFLLLVLITFLFFFFRLMPGDYTSLMVMQGASPEAVAAFEEKWGLNDPLYIQYLDYMANFLTGDAGVSLSQSRPVTSYVRDKIFNSMILIGPAITTGYLLGSIYGAIAGTKRGSKTEKYGIFALFFVGAFPSFFLAIVLVMIFAGWLGIFPTGGLISTETRLQQGAGWNVYFTWDFVHHYMLPFFTIVLRYTFLPALMMRTSVVEVLEEEFIFYQKITGLAKRDRLFNIAKHASLPVITLYPISLTRAIGGMVLIEVVFNWPGIGYALVQAVLASDYPVIQFVFFLIGAFIVVANFAVDILYGFIDPRITVEG